MDTRLTRDTWDRVLSMVYGRREVWPYDTPEYAVRRWEDGSVWLMPDKDSAYGYCLIYKGSFGLVKKVI